MARGTPHRDAGEFEWSADTRGEVGGVLVDVVERGAAERIEVLPDRVLLYPGDGDATVRAVEARGMRPLSVLVRRSTLEDVFLRLTDDRAHHGEDR